MLLDASGREFAGERQAELPASLPSVVQPPMISITRSFSYKLNLKNPDGSPTYESCDFFCSKGAECDPASAEEVSRDLYEFCMEQVLEDIRLFKERRSKKQAQRSAEQGRAA